jgi:ABC-type polysaccharide/polyol phosphate transport system ATPase subunit
MSIAIDVDRLSKRYLLGEREAYGALRDTLARALRAPLRWINGRAARASAVRESIWALENVSFDIRQGEIIGVVGRNGSGKSTLLKILSRITEPTSGRAEIRGRVGSLLEVGTGFHPELTGRENVFVNGAILGMRRAEIRRKFDEIVSFSGIEQFIDTPVKHYSSGMQMRLAFSVAAHLQPQILLIDEVLAVGDAAFQRKCLGKMDDVSRDGRTVVFVSHQMNQLRRLCGRCLWLDSGRVVNMGPTAELLNRYEASFMEASSSPADVQRSPGARFLGWTLGTSHQPRNTIQGFEPVTVRFFLRIDRPIQSGHHGIALFNRDSQVVWGTANDDLSFSPGTYELVYHLPLQLKPGSYRWQVSLFESGKFIDGVDLVPELSIETPPLGHRLDEYSGFLNLPYTFDVRRTDLSEQDLALRSGTSG